MGFRKILEKEKNVDKVHNSQTSSLNPQKFKKW